MSCLQGLFWTNPVFRAALTGSHRSHVMISFDCHLLGCTITKGTNLWPCLWGNFYTEWIAVGRPALSGDSAVLWNGVPHWTRRESKLAVHLSLLPAWRAMRAAASSFGLCVFPTSMDCSFTPGAGWNPSLSCFCRSFCYKNGSNACVSTPICLDILLNSNFSSY